MLAIDRGRRTDFTHHDSNPLATQLNLPESDTVFSTSGPDPAELDRAFIDCVRPERNQSIEDQVSGYLNGTCEWILSKPQFTSWHLEESPQLLFLLASPGRGKSVLAKYIVRYLRRVESKARVIEFRCSQTSGKCTAVTILKSFLFQLTDGHPHLAKHARLRFSLYENVRNVDDFKTLWAIFSAILRDDEAGEIYCILDGLDECDSASQGKLLVALRDEFLSPKRFHGRFLVTSRDTAIAADFKDEFNVLEIQGSDVQADIELYIDDELHSIQASGTTSEVQLERVKDSIAHAANGMFLWVRFVVEEIKGLTVEDPDQLEDIVDSILNSPHQKVEAFYIQSLQRLSPQQGAEVKLALHLLNCAEETLSTIQLAHALDLLNPFQTDQPFELWGREVYDLVLHRCYPFLEITKGDVNFTHQSARDVLSSDALRFNNLTEFSYDSYQAHVTMARRCLHHLLFPPATPSITDDAESSDSILESQIWEDTFYGYAAVYWDDHVRKCGENLSAIEDILIEFLVRSPNQFSNWAYHFGRIVRYMDRRHSLDLPLLHVLVRCELPEVVKLLFSRSTQHVSVQAELPTRPGAVVPKLDVNANDSFGRTALYFAVEIGSKKTAQLLVTELGADANVPDGKGITPLHVAATRGIEEIVGLLIEANAHLEAKDEAGDTALMKALVNGNEGSAKLLIDTGADINMKNAQEETTLHAAVNGGCLSLVKMLISSNISASIEDRKGWSPLHLAAGGDYTSILGVLFELGANIHACNFEGITALHNAAGSGSLASCRMLVQFGASLDAVSNIGLTPLHCAALTGEVGVASWLISEQVDLNARSKSGATPLYESAQEGHVSAVDVFLKAGADVKAVTNSGVTPLMIASANGHTDCVSLLLGSGSTLLDVRDDNGYTALTYAAANGAERVVHALLSAGASANLTDNNNRTPLMIASSAKRHDCVLALLAHNVQLDVRDVNLDTALNLSAANGADNIVESLLAAGARAHLPGSSGRTPLINASAANHLQCVLALLNRIDDVSLNETDENQDTALNVAAAVGADQIVGELLKAGANSYLLDCLSRTPLMNALLGNHLDCALLLLDHIGNDQLNQVDKNSFTVLNMAAKIGAYEVVRSLLVAGADGQIADVTGRTPLHYAIFGGHTEVAKLLVESGVDIDGKTDDGWSIAHVAAEANDVNTLRMLIAAHANMNARHQLGYTPLHIATQSDNLQVLAQLSEIVDPNCQACDGRQPLHFAAALGTTETVESLLHDFHVKQDAISRYDGNALNIATCRHREDIVTTLNARNLNETVYDGSGSTSLDHSSRRFQGLRTSSSEDLSMAVSAVPRRLRQTLTLVSQIEDIFGSKTASWRIFMGFIGRMLICLDDKPNAAVAFELDVIEKGVYNVSCNKCQEKNKSIEGKRFVCMTCLDVNLCEKCRESYEGFGHCIGHEFFEIPRSHGSYSERNVNDKGESAIEWLHTVHDKYLDELRQICPNFLDQYESKQPRYISDPSDYESRLSEIQVEVISELLEDLFLPVGMYRSNEQGSEDQGVVHSPWLSKWARVFGTSPIDIKVDILEATSALRFNVALITRILAATELLQDSGLCGSDFSIFVVDQNRPLVASAKRISKTLVESLEALNRAALDAVISLDVSHNGNITAEQLSITQSIVLELGLEAEETLEFLGFEILPRMGKRDLVEMIHYCILLNHVLALGLASYAVSHAFQFGEILFGQYPKAAFQLELKQTTIVFDQMELACMSEFVGGPIWSFSIGSMTRNSDGLYLSMYLHEVDDLWGPVFLRTDKDDMQNIRFAETERGAIVAAAADHSAPIIPKEDEFLCHWYEWSDDIKDTDTSDERHSNLSMSFPLFPKTKRLLIGAPSSQPRCIFEHKRSCSYKEKHGWTPGKHTIKYLGISPRRWELESAAFSIKGGQYFGGSANWTFKRIPGTSHKARIAMCFTQQTPNLGDLDYRLGLEVSVCTGNTRRTSLWECLKSPQIRDLVQNSVPGLPDKYLDALQSKEAFIRLWRTRQPPDSREPSLTEILKIIFTYLSYTGLDKHGNMLAWWGGDYLMEIKEDSNTWIRMLEETKNGVFAFVSEACLRCKCEGCSVEGVTCRSEDGAQETGFTAFLTTLSLKSEAIQASNASSMSNIGSSECTLPSNSSPTIEDTAAKTGRTTSRPMWNEQDFPKDFQML
jgi:ankyrin repeat protein